MVLQSTKPCLFALPRLAGWEHTAVPCMRGCSGFPRGIMLFFPAGTGGQRGWVCEGRQGRASTQPRSVPSRGLAAGLNEMLFPRQG